MGYRVVTAIRTISILMVDRPTGVGLTIVPDSSFLYYCEVSGEAEVISPPAPLLPAYQITMSSRQEESRGVMAQQQTVPLASVPEWKSLSWQRCDRKRPYYSMKKAASRAREKSLASGHMLIAYTCCHCGLFHIGHPDKSQYLVHEEEMEQVKSARPPARDNRSRYLLSREQALQIDQEMAAVMGVSDGTKIE
jgi:hypothetical protein